MSIFYNPDPAALVGAPANVSVLSQRDAGLQIPINFVKGASVSLTAACFGHNVFEAEAAARCISNLFAVGFKRFYLDLYWDPGHLYWSLCPAQLPLPNATAQPTITTTSSESSPDALGTAQFQTADNDSPTAAPQSDSEEDGDAVSQMQHLYRRQSQIASTSSGRRPPATTAQDRAVETSSPRPIATNAIPGLELYQVGPYSCNSYANASTFLAILGGFLEATDNTLQAGIGQVLFNLHVASSPDEPTAPAVRPADKLLPNSDNLIGSIAGSNFSNLLYAPGSLFAQRENLNASWSAAPPQDAPDDSYFKNTTIGGRASVSVDGWPSEGFLEFFKHYRVLFGYANIDPQLSDYDVRGDGNYVFAPGFLDDELESTIAANGSISSGCIYNPASPYLSFANSSWAYTSLDSAGMATSPVSISNAARNVTYLAANSLADCGIIPVLNATLSNTTADKDPQPYLAYAFSTVWSWAPNEPLNDALASQNGSSTDFRCAYLNASVNAPPNEGRWHVTSCQSNFYPACRALDNPYAWSISPHRDSYTDVADNCPDNSSFAVPRTALENRYLLSAAQSFFQDRARTSNDDDVDHDGAGADAVWINFNSIDVETCWVTGVDTGCPYTPTAGQNQGQVVVPIVAAFAIILLALLTILAKCGANRRKSRKRRRVKEGLEYEGVPS
ncbi:MAG: hypothetical protein Q9162_000129 [Coniocarpon cinnabarinum]